MNNKAIKTITIEFEDGTLTILHGATQPVVTETIEVAKEPVVTDVVTEPSVEVPPTV